MRTKFEVEKKNWTIVEWFSNNKKWVLREYLCTTYPLNFIFLPYQKLSLLNPTIKEKKN